MPDTNDRINEAIGDATTKAKQVTEKVGQKTNVVAGEANDLMSDAKGHGKNAIREGESWAKSAADAVMDRTSELTSSARAFAGQAAETSKDGYRQLAEQAEGGIRHAGAVVRANPGAAVTITFAVGFGLGFLLGQLPRPRRERSWFTG